MARGWNTKGMSTKVRNLYDVKKLTDPIDVHNVFSLLSGGSILRGQNRQSFNLDHPWAKDTKKNKCNMGIFKSLQKGLEIAPSPKSNEIFTEKLLLKHRRWEKLSLYAEPHRSRQIHAKSIRIRTCEQVNQLVNFNSLVQPGSRPDHDRAAANNTLERPQVVDGLIDYSIEVWKIAMKALFRCKTTWVVFWLGHLAMVQNWCWKLVHLNWKMETGTWILRPESISVTCNSLFVGLSLLQVTQSPCFETWKLRKPLGNKDWHTHTH